MNPHELVATIGLAENSFHEGICCRFVDGAIVARRFPWKREMKHDLSEVALRVENMVTLPDYL